MYDVVASKLLKEIARELSTPDIVFPTSFELTLRVQSLLKDQNIAINRIAEYISAEPLLSARIIAYANSVAIRGGGHESTSLQAAILRVGLDALRSVAYSVAMEQIIRSKHMARFQDLSQQIWEHSLAVAALARSLAREVRMDAEKAFYLGMVHDIGAFYLLFRCAADDVLVSDRDKLLRLIYEWHDGVGHALLSAMDQPEELLPSVQDHEGARIVTSLRTWTDILAVADCVSLKIADWVPPGLRERHPRKVAETIMGEDQENELLDRTRQELGALHAALF